MSQDHLEPTPINPVLQDVARVPQSLATLLAQARSGAAPETISGYTDRLGMVIRIAELLADGHAQGRVHGDLGPERVTVSPHGVITLDGWGAPPAQTPEAATYRAPQQVRGAAPDQAGDIYALGALLWELLTLRPPLLVEENLTRFWRRKKTGDLDPLPSEVKHHVPAELLAAARRALEGDPAARWPDVATFLAALRIWQRRLESVAVTLQAERALAQSPDGAGASDASSGFRSALQLWPENPVAQEGLAAANAVQALDAVKHGDAQRAAAFMPAAGSAQQVVAAQVTSLQRRQRRRTHLRLAVVLGLLLLAGGIAIGGWWLPRFRSTAWRTVAEWRPAPGAPLSGLNATLMDVHRPAPLAVPDATSFALPSSHIIWLNGVDGRGDVRVSVDLTWQDRVDGFEMMLGVPRMNPPAFWMTPPGYTCQFGGYQGTQTFISANATAGWNKRPSPVEVPFEPGRPYTLTFEKRGDSLRLTVDGREVYHLRSFIPIGDSRSRWIALRPWCEARISRIQVEKPLLPTVPGPLTTADTLAENGYYEDALSIYADLSQRAGVPADIAGQALAKAHLMASVLPDRDRQRRELFGRASAQLARTPLHWDVLQAESLARWQGHDWSGALGIARQVLAERPQERCALTLLEQRQPGVPEEHLEQLLALVRAGPEISFLDLTGLGLSHVRSLAGMRLRSLDLSANSISDLAPLQGMQLRSLAFSDNRVSDLAPLRGMPLTQLVAAGNRISDLTPLAGLRLSLLKIDGNQVRDLAPLRGMPLTTLEALGNPIADLAPLAGSTQLASLHLADAPISDISALALPSLRRLSLIRCPVTDLAPLAKSQVGVLSLEGGKATDLSALPRKTLRRLLLPDTAVADLASLAGMTLAELDLRRTAIASLDGMRQITCTPDASISLDGTAVADLRPLAGIERLAGLGLSGTRIRDLSPLAGLVIGSLALEGVPATDLSPLAAVPGVQNLTLWGCAATPAELDLLADRLEANRTTPLLCTRLRIQAAFQAKDWRRLRSMAKPIGKRMRLSLGVELTIAEARSLAAAAGAHLPCLIDHDDLQAVSSHPDQTSYFWVGLSPAGDGKRPPRWDDGRAMTDADQWLRPGPRVLEANGYLVPLAGLNEMRLTPSYNPVDRSGVVLEW